MKKLRGLRLMLLALCVFLIPALSFGEVFISVNFAPPPLPVYEQPVCPQDGWMWTPGYWAFDYDANDYYWVPGAWVPAPEVGMLWTPGYWGFASGAYVWYPGYWGPQVGYYGGVDYGFGYMGIGFAGGEWRGGFFAYNEAVVHVDRRIVHSTYIDRRIVERTTIMNDRHAAYSGGPGGINHRPTPQESAAMHERHVAATSVQTQHANVAMRDRSSFAKANGGHPATTAVARPLTPGGRTGAAPSGRGGITMHDNSNQRQAAPANQNGGNRGGANPGSNRGAAGNTVGGARPTYTAPQEKSSGVNPLYENNRSTQAPPPQGNGGRGSQSGQENQGQRYGRPQQDSRPVPQPQPEVRPVQPRPAQPQPAQPRPVEPQPRPMPGARPQPESRPAPPSAAPRTAPTPQPQRGPGPDSHQKEK